MPYAEEEIEGVTYEHEPFEVPHRLLAYRQELNKLQSDDLANMQNTQTVRYGAIDASRGSPGSADAWAQILRLCNLEMRDFGRYTGNPQLFIKAVELLSRDQKADQTLLPSVDFQLQTTDKCLKATNDAVALMLSDTDTIFEGSTVVTSLGSIGYDGYTLKAPADLDPWRIFDNEDTCVSEVTIRSVATAVTRLSLTKMITELV